VLRVVVKDGFSHDMANMLLGDLRRHLEFFASQPGYKPKLTGGGDSHGIAPRNKKATLEASINR
jgi:glutamate decarboxylase